MKISINQNTQEFLRAEGRSILLLQDSNAYTFTRSDNSLLISTESGDEALVEDFFVLGENDSLPVFVVGSGENIQGADFLSSMNPQLDLATAAGSANSTAQGSGSGEYSDAAGDLIDGLDRLGSLGTSHWDMRLGTTEVLHSDSSDPGIDTGSSLTPPPVTPPVTPPIDPITPGVFVRGVMYNDGNSTDSVSVNIFFPNADDTLAKLGDSEISFSGQNPSARYHVDVGFPDGWDESWVAVSYNPVSGRLEFNLTAEGIGEMGRLGLEGKNLLDFIEVEVIDSANPGVSFGYLVEIVAGNNSIYDSEAQDALDQAGGYPTSGKELIGEFHYGKGQAGVYQITSSEKEDEIVIDDRVLGGSEIYANGSEVPSSGANDSNVIFLNQGMQASQSTVSTIISDNGTVRVSSDSYDALYAGTGGINKIYSKDIEIITTGLGSAAMYAEGGGNFLYAEGGSITISGDYGLYTSGALNQISVKDGGTIDISTLIDDGTALSADKGGANIIKGDGGTVINIKGSVNTVNANSETYINNIDGQYIGDGLHLAKNDGKNVIKAHNIEISGLVQSLQPPAGPDPDRIRQIPVRATTILDAGDDGSIKLTGGVLSIGKGALVDLYGADISIKKTTAYIGSSAAISAESGSRVKIDTNDGELSVETIVENGSSSSVQGIFAFAKSRNTITTKNMDLIVKSSGSSEAEGIVADRDSENFIHSSGKLLIDVSSESNAYGIFVRGAVLSRNDIKAEELELNVTSTGGIAAGIRNTKGSNIIVVDNNATIKVMGKGTAAAFYNTESGQQELIVGNDLTINVESTNGEAYGTQGEADLYASSVTMTIKGDLSAIVMDGKGSITGENITLSAESVSGTSYGMHNIEDSRNNIVQAKEGVAFELEINADYAMYASAGSNSIIGNLQGNAASLITLNGDIYQSGTGHNSVLTGAGADSITINGAISGAGAIYIDGGEGYDTLILKADNATDFITKYGAWLNSLDSDILKGIENIDFSGITDLSSLSPALDAFFGYAQGAGIEINGVSPLAFGAEALEESAFMAQADDESDDESDNNAAGENGYSDDSADYATSLAELDLSDLLRSGESEDNFELSLGKIYTDQSFLGESFSGESIFQNLSEPGDLAESVDFLDMVGTSDNHQSLDILFGEIKDPNSQDQSEASAATTPSDQGVAELEPESADKADNPSSHLLVDTFRDEASDQDMLTQLDILTNFN